MEKRVSLILRNILLLSNEIICGISERSISYISSAFPLFHVERYTSPFGENTMIWFSSSSITSFKNSRKTLIFAVPQIYVGLFFIEF